MHAVEHLLLAQEAHLRLRGVHIDVHKMLRQVQMQHAGRETTLQELIAVGLLERGRHELGADMPPVDKKDLAAPRAARRGRAGHKARDGELVPAPVHRGHLLRGLAAHDGIDRAEELAVAGRGELLLPVAQHAHGDLRMGQRKALHRAEHGGGLHGVALHELHARRCIVKQVTHEHGRAVRTARLAALRHDARLEMQTRAEGRVRRLRQHVDARDGGNGRQRLAAEAERVDGLQIGRLMELARGMAQEGRLHILCRHAAAVVRHAQERHAPVAQLDRDLMGPGVDGVFDQLLCGAGRALHDLASGDQVGDMGRKLLDLWHNYLTGTLASASAEGSRARIGN